MSEEDVYQEAIETWGEDVQVQIAIEEVNELGAELSRHLRGRGNSAAICEEIADVEIMLEQLRHVFGDSPVDTAKDAKLGRLRDRMEADDE
ncbi:hypothetical protein [Halolamina rubra]|uniref:hypothetical protein n=1 Tax=Halolamina rubra TaxID=1380430 RepID=UPI000679E927|nr:hypothetical protein [Halolamina rubra]